MAVKRSKGSVSAADLPTEGIFLTRVRGRAKHYYIIAADAEQARSILHHYNDTEIAAGHPALFPQGAPSPAEGITQVMPC